MPIRQYSESLLSIKQKIFLLVNYMEETLINFNYSFSSASVALRIFIFCVNILYYLNIFTIRLACIAMPNA